jgi:hypothetical protein
MQQQKIKLLIAIIDPVDSSTSLHLQLVDALQ